MRARGSVFVVLLGSAIALSAQASDGERAVGGLLSGPPPAQPSADPELDVIARALDPLAALAPREKAVHEAVEAARTALRDARAALAAHQPERGARKKQLARAALELAQRIAARLDEQRAAATAEQRARLAEQARADAIQALANAEARLRAVQGAAP